MKKIISNLCILVIGGLLISCSDQKIDKRYGVSFNPIREKNGIPALPEGWRIINPFKSAEITWCHSDTGKGFVGKKLIMKNGKADHESDTYYSGRKIPIRDMDHAGQYCEEDVVICYFYDNSEQNLIKVEAYTNSKAMGIISFYEAKEILEKWGIKIPIPQISTQ